MPKRLQETSQPVDLRLLYWSRRRRNCCYCWCYFMFYCRTTINQEMLASDKNKLPYEMMQLNHKFQGQVICIHSVIVFVITVEQITFTTYGHSSIFLVIFFMSFVAINMLHVCIKGAKHFDPSLCGNISSFHPVVSSTMF